MFDNVPGVVGAGFRVQVLNVVLWYLAAHPSEIQFLFNVCKLFLNVLEEVTTIAHLLFYIQVLLWTEWLVYNWRLLHPTMDSRLWLYFLGLHALSFPHFISTLILLLPNNSLHCLFRVRVAFGTIVNTKFLVLGMSVLSTDQLLSGYHILLFASPEIHIVLIKVEIGLLL